MISLLCVDWVNTSKIIESEMPSFHYLVHYSPELSLKDLKQISTKDFVKKNCP